MLTDLGLRGNLRFDGFIALLLRAIFVFPSPRVSTYFCFFMLFITVAFWISLLVVLFIVVHCSASPLGEVGGYIHLINRQI